MPRVSIEQALELAAEHCQAGRLAQTETIFRCRAESATRTKSEASRLLALVAYSMGKTEAAGDLLREFVSHKHVTFPGLR